MPNTAILFCLYNHSHQLEGRADGTSIYPRDPIRKETTIKREWKETGEAGWRPPQHTRGTRKSSLNHAEDQSSLVNSVHLSLIVKNTVLTVVHIAKV